MEIDADSVKADRWGGGGGEGGTGRNGGTGGNGRMGERGGGGGGTDAPNRLFMKGVRLSVSPFFFPHQIYSLSGFPDLNVTPQQLATFSFSFFYTLT